MGPRDSKGRSLRELQLTTRLMKYPLSYLIYSEQFAALPELVRRGVWRRIDDVLEGRDTRAKFAHLSAADRPRFGRLWRVQWGPSLGSAKAEPHNRDLPGDQPLS